ncbi:SusF/SusE family outer membrane protein [Prevotella copri]|uniref:SusF/SusE family outer membrane protein n=1 Tax=Segatella copri TaxID=165179 RepID=A0A6A7W9K3_9BACT|nr:SusF/SusE family outer membrane protein [Segatella copri]MQP11169.1 SusF/SusE family outer membrane protein [Segatella copri]
MKKIFKFMLLPALVLPLLFTSCDEDRDSNPTLDLSHLAEGFVLNTPALAENNTYDLNSAKNLVLTCSQPNYGNVPYAVKYYAQVSIDPTFVSDPAATHVELATYADNASSLEFNASEVNDAVVSLFQAANPDTSVPEEMPIYIRLRAVIGGTLNQTLGETYSNVITLPSVKATYEAPDAKFTDNLFLIGSSIQTPWQSWKPIPQVQGLDGNYYGIIYVPAGGEFKWGTENNDYRGINRLKEINDVDGAGISAGENQTIKVANAGWYTLHFKGKITEDKKNIDWTLTVYKTQVCLIGTCIGQTAWGFADDTALTAPDDPSGEWVSPAFTASEELRVAVKVGDIDWYRTEFTVYNGEVFWRKYNMPNNWAETMGEAYSVKPAVGTKLYVNFDTNKAEVR